MTNTITDHFKGLTPNQVSLFEQLGPLYSEWNEKINVISRKDIDNLYLHHVLHSLAIAKAVTLPSGSSVLDLGTGGGFPGIPLAILFPEVSFTLCDSVGKKIKVAKAVSESLGLKNVRTVNCRAESLQEDFDYIVSRAVADLSDFYGWVKGKYRNQIIYLKGGDVEDEITRCASRWRIKPSHFTFCDINIWFNDEYFKEKKIILISR